MGLSPKGDYQFISLASRSHHFMGLMKIAFARCGRNQVCLSKCADEGAVFHAIHNFYHLGSFTRKKRDVVETGDADEVGPKKCRN